MGFWNDGVRSDSPRRSSNQYTSRPSGSRSNSSFFGAGSSRGYSASRGYSSRAQPRRGLMARMQRWLRKLYDYMRRNPVKVFMLVIMPLITGGVLTKLLSRFGVRLPRSLEQLTGGGGGGGGRGGNGRYYSKGGARDYQGGSELPGMGGGIGSAIQGAFGLAKMFM